MKTVSLKYTEPGQEPALKEFRLWHVSPCGNLGVIHDLDWQIAHIPTATVLNATFDKKTDAIRAAEGMSSPDWAGFPNENRPALLLLTLSVLGDIPHRAYATYATNIGPNGATRVRIR